MAGEAKKDFYKLIVDAQKSDSSGRHEDAFVQYLDGISALCSYLKRESELNSQKTIGSVNQLDCQIQNGVMTLKHCVERLEVICNRACAGDNGDDTPRDNPDNTTSRDHHPLKVKIPPAVDNTSCSPSSHSCNSTHSLLYNQSDLFKTTSLTQPSTPPSVSSTSLDKAYKENALLIKIFDHRLRTIKEPLKKASLQLELQRRLTENITLAKTKDAEKYHEQHLRERKALEEAASKLLEQKYLLKIPLEVSETMAYNRQHLYAQILQYEANQSKNSTKFRLKVLNPDVKLVNDIASQVLSLNEHPLNQWMKKFQQQMQNRIDPLLNRYLNQRCIREENNLLNDENSLDLMNCSHEHSIVINEMIVFDKLEAEAIERHFHNITSDISLAHETITLMLTLIMFDNKQYYIASNNELLRQQHNHLNQLVADFLYPPIWCLLNNLYRIVYYKHEESLQMAMHELYLFNELQTEWANVDPQVIDEAAFALKSIIPLQTPYSKLKAMVRLTQKLCNKLKSREIFAEVTADELVPVLCLVTLKAGSPQLISECYAIEQLVDGKYLMGEEGYCLSSIQMALKYIEMSSKNCRNDSSKTCL